MALTTKRAEVTLYKAWSNKYEGATGGFTGFTIKFCMAQHETAPRHVIEFQTLPQMQAQVRELAQARSEATDCGVYASISMVDSYEAEDGRILADPDARREQKLNGTRFVKKIKARTPPGFKKACREVETTNLRPERDGEEVA